VLPLQLGQPVLGSLSGLALVGYCLAAGVT
jgi:hypothetical protein